MPFFFHIDIDFDYLNVSIPKFSNSLVNTSGAVTFTNKNGTILTFDNTFSNYNDVPIKIDGHINLSEKLIDINLKNIEPVSNEFFASNTMIQNVMKHEYFLDVNYQVRGKLLKPNLTFNVDVDDLIVKDRSFQPLSLIIRDKKGHYFIASTPSSSIQVSGNVLNDSIALNVSNFPFDFPFLSSNSFLNFDLKVTRDNDLYLIQMDQFDDLSFSGFEFDGFNMFVDVQDKTQFVIPTLNIDLKNGQQLVFQADYHYKEQLLNFKQVNLLFNKQNDQDKYIYSMDTKGTISRIKERWQFVFESQLSGLGAEYNGVLIDEFSLDYRFDNGHHFIAMDSLRIDNGKLIGDLIFKDRQLILVDLNVDALDLKRLRTLHDFANSNEFAGVIDGDFTYDYRTSKTMRLKMDVNGFQTIFGQFGNVKFDTSIKNDVVTIHHLYFKDIHDLNLKGEVKKNGFFDIELLKPGRIRLDAIELFSKLGVRGFLNLKGGFKGPFSRFTFDGKLYSKNLEYKRFVFDYIYFDGKFDSRKLRLRDSKILFDNGQMFAKGFLNYQLNEGRDFSFSDYNLDMVFDQVNLNYLSQLYLTFSNSVQPVNIKLDKSFDQFEAPYEYHKYQADNFQNFQHLNQFFSQSAAIDLPIDGKLDGYLKVNNNDVKSNRVDLQLTDFNYKNNLYFDLAELKSEQINAKSELYKFQIFNLQYKKKLLPYLSSDILLQPKIGLASLINLDVHFQDRVIFQPIALKYNFLNDWFTASFLFNDDDLTLLSVPFTAVKGFSNQGKVRALFEGPLNDVRLVSADIDLNQFSMVFDDQNSMFDSAIFIDDYTFFSQDGYLDFHDLMVYWKGQDTFRRVTREEKRNEFKIKGKVGVKSIDLKRKKQFVIDYNLFSNDSFFSINFPKVYSGDIIANQVSLVGTQAYELSETGRVNVRNLLRTDNESGPLLKGKLVFRDGIFNVPKMRGKKNKPRFLLDLDTTIAEGNYIQGSLVGDGVYNLATNISLEIDEKMSLTPFTIKGTINAPQFSTEIPFYEGSIAILDGVYELLSRDQQAYFFKDIPEFISPHYVRIEPIKNNEKHQLKTTMHLRALRKKESQIATENIRNDQLPYHAIGLAIDGTFKNRIPKITVLDFEIDNLFSLYPSFELYGNYEIKLDNQTMLSETSYYGLSLLMPEVITNSEGITFTSYGRQRINTYIKSSIRPYERRLAKRIGLYDLRINYDFGKTILNSEADSFQQEDLLGVQFVSDLYDSKMFLSLRTDMNLSADHSNDNARGVKITQVDFTYYFQPNFSVGLKNVNEYSEVTIFDPRWSLNYGYSF